MYLIHLNDFYEFGSIEANSKKYQNIEKIRFNIPGKFFHCNKLCNFKWLSTMMSDEIKLFIKVISAYSGNNELESGQVSETCSDFAESVSF